jgi:hypothetical protein
MEKKAMAVNRFKATLEKMIEKEAQLDTRLQEELKYSERQINSFRQACKDLPLTKDNLIPDSEDGKMVVSATICQLEFICGFFRWYPITWDGNDICFGLVNRLGSELGYFSLRDISKVNPQLKKDFRKQPYQCLEMKPCDSSDSEPSSPMLPVKSFLEVKKSIMGDDYDCLTENMCIGSVFDHFADDELKSFREDIAQYEEIDKDTFMETLENHIYHSLLVLRFGEKGAKEQMELLWAPIELLWVPACNESEASTPTLPIAHISDSDSEVSAPCWTVLSDPSPGEKSYKMAKLLMERMREGLDSLSDLVLSVHVENCQLKDSLKDLNVHYCQLKDSLKDSA